MQSQCTVEGSKSVMIIGRNTCIAQRGPVDVLVVQASNLSFWLIYRVTVTKMCTHLGVWSHDCDLQ